MARLGINIEEVAFLREARESQEPDPVMAAMVAELGGCDGIVLPVRPELRPITERDVRILRETIKTHLTLQLPPMERWIGMALNWNPDMITLAPVKKAGTTAGGGLDVMGHADELASLVREIRDKQVVASVLIDPQIHQIKAAAKVGFDYVEFHMGSYVNAQDLNERADQLENLSGMALAGSKIGMGVSLSCGLNYQNVSEVAAVSGIEEIIVGHAVIVRSLWIGLEAAVRDMAALVHRF